ncbi:uncharacterized protein BJ212DRAFT_1303337 [Suillus subaureus]|uniref:Uncharacterized protein n=1 Tax=Suillus subaureus TaxID=48587 RepID=A0A9P7E0K6_9AGAM|nr:uncharacterized protein BJ212DRAFT_1303337 [Suillus subaureus]KAG1807616.1 hypothetical protein BJ212DRAFT_1303337 [Suillus subaureus]
MHMECKKSGIAAFAHSDSGLMMIADNLLTYIFVTNNPGYIKIFLFFTLLLFVMSNAYWRYSGVPFETMESMGRWGGDAFAGYLRQHVVVLAPYLQDTPILKLFKRYALPPVR